MVLLLLACQVEVKTIKLRDSGNVKLIVFCGDEPRFLLQSLRYYVLLVD